MRHHSWTVISFSLPSRRTLRQDVWLDYRLNWFIDQLNHWPTSWKWSRVDWFYRSVIHDDGWIKKYSSCMSLYEVLAVPPLSVIMIIKWIMCSEALFCCSFIFNWTSVWVWGLICWVLAEIPLASYWQAEMCDVKQYLAGKLGGEHGVFASFLYPFLSSPICSCSMERLQENERIKNKIHQPHFIKC